MNQEDVLVLLVVFVLGFVVSRMMSGRLVEGKMICGNPPSPDTCTCKTDDDCKAESDPSKTFLCPVEAGEIVYYFPDGHYKKCQNGKCVCNTNVNY